ncbi:hypothetical protein Brms1b_007352 [Colletotrichum noveboracense]|nr:hypothetical protein Brms1b_007352 [Colletotrichum noveboracense]
MEMLERQTGLSRQQITNWLANTRRRNRFKVPPKRPPSPAITSATSKPINIGGSSVPQGFDEMNPLQRWQVSPPEHEPALASAIAHAVYDLPPGSDTPADRSLTDSAPTRSLIDHIAEHFKDGKTMEEWHGDWGFDDHILKMVENSMAPYMIHMERYSPWPFTTKQGVPETPPSAFELIKTEINHFATDYQNTNGRMPTNAELLYESCCIIFGSEPTSLAKKPVTPASSWLRDLLMSSDVIVKQARVRPLKTARRSRITYLCINGKADIFDQCALEEQLQSYVDISKLIEPEVSDSDLQREACSIVQQVDSASSCWTMPSSPRPSETFSTFLYGLINESTHWLAPFRQRMQLPPSESADSPTLDIGNQHFLSAALTEPTGQSSAMDTGSSSPEADVVGSSATGNTASGADAEMPGLNTRTTFFVNEENCYRRLALSLVRFVKITTSPRNPNRHIPSDAELQHQARWISFEDDDPWNQTPADNPDWLREFKREMGILQEDDNPPPA